MKNKEKGNTGKLILLGLMAILLVVGLTTYARYASSVQGTGTAQTALYTNDAAFTVPVKSLPTHPGESIEIPFTVSNTKDGKTAEVAMTYDFLIETAGNLPFTFQVSNDDGTNWNDLTANTQSSYKFKFELTGKTDNCKLRITWPTDKNSDEYVNEVDYVKIRVKMEQKVN